MNPNVNESGSTRVKGPASKEGVDGASMQTAKQSPLLGGTGHRAEKHWGTPQQIQRAKKLVLIILGALIVADGLNSLVRREGHGSFFGDAIPGFSTAYGLLSAVLIIVVAKFVGQALVRKSEDYYD